MKIYILLAFLFLFYFYVNADISREDFIVIDISNNFSFDLGNRLYVLTDLYPDLTYIGIKIFGNFPFNEYHYKDLFLYTSGYSRVEREANILIISINSTQFSTYRGIKIGDTINNVLLMYGEPTYSNNNSFYYFNTVNDLLELQFTFNEENLVSSIILSADI